LSLATGPRRAAAQSKRRAMARQRRPAPRPTTKPPPIWAAGETVAAARSCPLIPRIALRSPTPTGRQNTPAGSRVGGITLPAVDADIFSEAPQRQDLNDRAEEKLMRYRPSPAHVAMAAAAFAAGAIVLVGTIDAHAAGSGRSHANAPASCGSQCVAKPPQPARKLTAPTGPARLTNPCPHKRGGAGGMRNNCL